MNKLLSPVRGTLTVLRKSVSLRCGDSPDSERARTRFGSYSLQRWFFHFFAGSSGRGSPFSFLLCLVFFLLFFFNSSVSRKTYESYADGAVRSKGIRTVGREALERDALGIRNVGFHSHTQKNFYQPTPSPCAFSLFLFVFNFFCPPLIFGTAREI